MGRSTLTPAGRGVLVDHPDTLRMEREAIAGLRREDRIQARLEGRALAVARDDLGAVRDFDRVDRDYKRMAAAEHRPDYDNWGRSTV